MTYEGKKIVEFRRMTEEELEREGWDTPRYDNPPVLVLDDGSTLFPSRDEEGNGPGALFGTEPDGTPIYAFPPTEDADE